MTKKTRGKGKEVEVEKKKQAKIKQNEEPLLLLALSFTPSPTPPPPLLPVTLVAILKKMPPVKARPATKGQLEVVLFSRKGEGDGGW